MRINKSTIEQLRNFDPKPCEEGIEAALAWIGDRDEELSADLWREFYGVWPDHAEWFLAYAPITPSVLKRLAVDEGDEVRKCVALNANCPAGVLETLAADESAGVREHVARNANCPASALAALAADEDKWVREIVAQNANCPVDVLGALSQDESEWVRAAAKKALTR